MKDAPAIVAWARSAVTPVGGGLSRLQPHDIGAPIVQSLLQRAGVDAQQVDAIVLGNALGAGGNPARMTALAAGLARHCAALTIDTQCCAGLDALAVAVGLIQSGQAHIVIAGGVEAWSRAPIRMTRPLHADEAPMAYERPPFSPDPAQDPDLLHAAAEHALERGYTRAQQDAYVLHSHQRAHALIDPDIVPIAGQSRDTYPRQITPERAARMPVIAQGLSALTISAKADGAAMVLVASPQACHRLRLQARARWVASVSVGADPAMPLTAAATAAQRAMASAAHRLALPSLDARALHAIELHDAFAAQGLSFCAALDIPPQQINTGGGGIARGHPIGASGAIALVRLLGTLNTQPFLSASTALLPPAGRWGLAAIAGAGGLGAACVIHMEAPH